MECLDKETTVTFQSVTVALWSSILVQLNAYFCGFSGFSCFSANSRI